MPQPPQITALRGQEGSEGLRLQIFTDDVFKIEGNSKRGLTVSALIFMAVIGAAMLHAAWNALVKGGSDKTMRMGPLF